MSTDHASEPLRVTVSTGPQGTCLVLSGELDVATAAHLLDVVEAVCAGGVAGAGLSLPLDLAALSFVDAAGLGALLEAGRIAGRRGHRVSVIRARPMARRLLELTGLVDVLDVRPPGAAPPPAVDDGPPPAAVKCTLIVLPSPARTRWVEESGVQGPPPGA